MTNEHHTHDSHPTLPAQEARQGKTLGVMRYVLGISLGLAVVAGVLWCIWPISAEDGTGCAGGF